MASQKCLSKIKCPPNMPEVHLISVAQEHAELLWKLGIDSLALESDFSAAPIDWDTHQRLLMEHFQKK